MSEVTDQYQRASDQRFGRFRIRVGQLPPGDVDGLPHRVGPFMRFFIRQAWPLLLAVMALGAAVALLDVMIPYLVGRFVDVLTSDLPDAEKQEQIWWLLGIAVFVLAMNPLLHAVQIPLQFRLFIGRFSNIVRRQCHRYTLGHSVSFFHNDYAGRIANKIAQTGRSLREFINGFIGAVWYVATFALLALWLMLQANPWLLVPMGLWMCGYFIALGRTVPRVKTLSANASDQASRVVGRLVDIYNNITTAKLFARSRDEDGYVLAALRDSTRALTRLVTTIGKLVFTLHTLNAALLISLLSLSVWLWGRGNLTVGSIAMVMPLANQITGMAHWIMWEVTDMFENLGTVEDGVHTFARPRHVLDRPDAGELVIRPGGGEVVFDHVTFHYGKGGGVIEDLNLTIPAGQKVGLVGRSGAGKSTLVSLLLRFHDLEGGSIRIDGQDTAAVTQASLRRHIAMVTQEPSLLNRSIRENIRYGRADATEEEVIEAARRAHAHEFITELQDAYGNRGYDAVAGERGVKLSGGQRQRIAIARVILENAPILVLDEATSALDSEIEAAIQEEIGSLMEGRTVIAIAHRLSTIQRMDRLIVMDEGRVIEDGHHEELLAANGHYARLWRMQSGGFLRDVDQPTSG